MKRLILPYILLKELHLMEDLFGVKTALQFMKTKEGHEIDFLIVIENQPKLLIEIKWSDDSPHKGFRHFNNYFPHVRKLQLVKEISREKTYPDGLEIRSLIPWLRDIDFVHFVEQV